MSRAVYVLRNGELVDKRYAAPLHHASAAPNIRTDGMDPLQSMADGKHYDSKSAYYASIRRAGCEIVGDDRNGFSSDRGLSEVSGHDVKRAIEQLRERR